MKWWKEQLEKRQWENASRLRQWEAQCAECEVGGSRMPPKPKCAAKEKTPLHFESVIAKVEALTEGDLLKLQKDLEGVDKGEEQQRILLQ